MLRSYINKLPFETTVLVTGAKGDIGSTVCEELRQNGYSVTGVDIDDFNITDKASIKGWAWGRILPDVIINCAGFNPLGSKGEFAAQTMNINAFGATSLREAFEQRAMPRIFIDIISNSANRPRSGSKWYCASKAAQQMMCRTHARENGEGRITFGINFGMISGTKNFTQVKELFPESEAALTCQEAAETIVSLMEATNKSFNGSILTFDAGETF